MRYDTYRYLWPPRPEAAAPPELIRFYEKRGWHGQIKKNGTCTVIFSRGHNVIFKTRHDDDHKAWSPHPSHTKFFGGRPDWNVYVAELLHSKGPTIKNHLYLFDVLVNDGHQLIDVTTADRQAILAKRFPAPQADIAGSRAGLGAIPITDDISRAENFERIGDVWHRLGVLDEGIVFKNPLAVLQPCTGPICNASWQVKVRRPHTNYSF
jgi:hypothetical protein